MARLIDLRPDVALPTALTVTVGDVLVFGATGGMVRSGGDAVELVGVFSTGVVTEDGRILTPMGAPDTVIFRACRPGLATIEVVTGDPWYAYESSHLRLAVEPAAQDARDGSTGG